MKQLRDLIGKDVEIIANGIVYRGVLKDVSEHSASILASYGWIEIQMAGINKISEPGAALSDTYTRYVNPSFFRNI